VIIFAAIGREAKGIDFMQNNDQSLTSTRPEDVPA